MSLNPLLSSQSPAWETIHAIIGGVSAIDVPMLPIRTLREAEDFLSCYGFDLSNEAHRDEVESLRRQSIAFIEEELLSGEDGVEMPLEVKAQDDVRWLLRWTSMKVGARQRWSCALLRVMHTLSHCFNHLNARYGDEIRAQILNRFKPHLVSHEDGALTLGRGPGSVKLVQFQIKAVKPVKSLALKLLHKAENVAADIFDRVGVRFVTRERLDTLFVVDYLRMHNVLMFANVKPSRSRNTLIDLEWLKGELFLLEEEVRAGRMARYQRIERLRELTMAQPFPNGKPSYGNAFSSVEYHSIQFTCRQMIRVPGKQDDLTEMVEALKRGEMTAERLADELSRRGDSLSETRFFFPFEVQIMDEESYRISREGLASHDVYKSRQLAAVKKRVLGDLLPGIEVSQEPETGLLSSGSAPALVWPEGHVGLGRR